MNKKLNGQILIMVLLMLSVLSILVIAVVSTTTKDIGEQVENKKYEQYNSANEKIILQTQLKIGIKSITDITAVTSTVGAASPCVGGTNLVTCTFSPTIDSTNSEIGQTSLKIEDTAAVSNYTLLQDKTLTLDIQGQVSSQEIAVTPNAAVDWVISFDYRDGAGNYKTITKVLDSATAPAYQAGSQQPPTCILQQTAGSTYRFSLASCGITSPIYLRLKPLGSSPVTLSVTGLTTPQMRTITSVTTAVSTAAVPGPSIAPSSVLELQYPLHSSALDIFDYVLRSESTLTK